MSRRLYLMRHAKSSWDDAAPDDRGRDLSARGRAAADRMGAFCGAERIAPALVLCSTARRARETLARLVPHLPGSRRIEFEDGLYLAGAAELVRRLRRVEDPVRSVMLVGHNPGLQELAATLCASGDEAALARLRGKYPTGALAEITLPIEHWRQLEIDTGMLVRFVAPRDLA
ncbi:MAG: histidine phosphatase family protein [Alphaproteobacteria bacterium]|nr:histidine phosphatase family protein [Alphaproteobacteria bacterium]